VVAAADGQSDVATAQQLSVNRKTVILWRQRFSEQRLDGLWEIAAGRGRKPNYDTDKIAAIVDATLQTKPEGMTHWSCRTMAESQGVSKSTINNIWQAHQLKPHRVKTFKLSRDPKFLEKMTDVIGLYLNPPQQAIVLCVDEKSQIQALDRTQPGLPINLPFATEPVHNLRGEIFGINDGQILIGGKLQERGRIVAIGIPFHISAKELPEALQCGLPNLPVLFKFQETVNTLLHSLRRHRWLGFAADDHLIDELPRNGLIVCSKRLFLANFSPTWTRFVPDDDERTLQLRIRRAVHIPLLVVAATLHMPSHRPQHGRILPLLDNHESGQESLICY
jgi:hypothetical protein